MAIEIKFLMDGLDRGQPLNPEDFGFNIAEDDSIGSRVCRSTMILSSMALLISTYSTR
jgi:hypothetical protein